MWCKLSIGQQNSQGDQKGFVPNPFTIVNPCVV